MLVRDLAALFSSAHDQTRPVMIRVGDHLFPVDCLQLLSVPARPDDVVEIIADVWAGESAASWGGPAALTAGAS